MHTTKVIEQGPLTGSTMQNREAGIRMFDDCQNGAVAFKLSTLLMSQRLMNPMQQDNLDATKTIPNFWPTQLSLDATDILFLYILTRLMKYTARCFSVAGRVLLHALMPKRNEIEEGQGTESTVFKVKPNDQDDIKCILNQVSYNNCKITTFQGYCSFTGYNSRWTLESLKT